MRPELFNSKIDRPLTPHSACLLSQKLPSSYAPLGPPCGGCRPRNPLRRRRRTSKPRSRRPRTSACWKRPQYKPNSHQPPASPPAYPHQLHQPNKTTTLKHQAPATHLPHLPLAWRSPAWSHRSFGTPRPGCPNPRPRRGQVGRWVGPGGDAAVTVCPVSNKLYEFYLIRV